jgi:hypothetical protein
MKSTTIFAALLLTATYVHAQDKHASTYQSPGMFSLGTRNTVSMFNDDKGIGTGIGGQARVQLTDHLGTEWFFDYITSKNGSLTYRNDYHFGWSVMYYPVKDNGVDRFLQPYIIAGHCFDYSKVMQQSNRSNNAGRWSMATQAGLGTHFNINRRFDCSLSTQYMLHFGKEIQTSVDKGNVVINKKDMSTPDGHLLITLSFNYKFFHWWNVPKA